MGSKFDQQPLVEFMQNNKTIGMAAYVVYAIISTVIIALPIVPLMPIALHLYGLFVGGLITLLGTLIGSAICFYLARRYGKKMVVKMMGKHLFSEIEHLTHVDNPKTFFFVRIFGNNYFDTISYIAGLSKIKFTSYFLITLVVSVPWTLGMFYAIQQLGGLENMKSFMIIMTAYAALILIGTVMWELYHGRHKKE